MRTDDSSGRDPKTRDSRGKIRWAGPLRASFVAAPILVAALIASLSLTQNISGDENYAVTIDRDIAMTTRDGVTLFADVYRPKASGKFPVLLTRTPYNKLQAYNTNLCMRAAEAGYACVVQDVRGRFLSGGEWYPFKHESQDGYDTVEWLAHQPWSTGMIGMFGGSYVGATQLLAAIAKPPHLAGLFLTDTPSDYYRNWIYHDGPLSQWFAESWASGNAEDTQRRYTAGEKRVLDWVNMLPLGDYPILKAADTKTVATYFQDWLAHPTYDEYWKQWSIEADYSRIQVPAFHVGAWYDLFLGGTLRNYQGLKAGAGMIYARNNQRLTIDIAGHSRTNSSTKIGDVDFGQQAGWDQTGALLRWYDYIIKSAPNGMDQEKPVRVFTMGRNEWRDFDDWPPPGAEPQRMYLHSSGSANGSAGAGSLSTTAPSGDESPDHYVYDPANPVQTRGGPLCCENNLLTAGPKEQRDIETRKDILIYSTEALSQEIDVTGPVTVELYVKSSAVDTDFTAKLVDVWPSGFVQNITEGILRMRYRNSREKPELMKPGDVYKITVDLWATSNVFQAGHKLRIEVSSSNYPRFDRNLNTGDPDIAHATKKVVATNTILHDKDHPSAIVLSVLPAQKY
jgi:putative CocE/NonD family hydrolase